MAKRRATTELNRDNWDLEDESEDPGTFKRLSGDELKNRVIRKAKRSLLPKDASGTSPFAAFSGFSKSAGNTNPFNFLKNNIEENASVNIPPNKDDKKNGSAASKEEKIAEMEVTNTKQTTDSNKDQQKPIRNLEYYRQLQSLNESVMKWMQLHLSKNSCCDFTPVFNDYKKHLDTLNVTYPVKSKGMLEGKSSVEGSSSTDKDSVVKKPDNTGFFFSQVNDKQTGDSSGKGFFNQVKPSATANSPKQSASPSKQQVNHGFKFGDNKKSEDEETDYGANFKSNTTNTSTFSFGIKKTPTATSSISSGPTTSSEESMQEKKPFQFSFGLNTKVGSTEDSVSKPFTFTSTPTEKAASESTADGEAEYVPPKNDFVAVKEEDALYSKRCKLFYKKDDSYIERGIGTLHLKPLDGKTQLLMRADTSLGNILLNIVVSDSLPMSRTGKNNVLLVCVPNPPLDMKNTDSKEAIPMLIRVKTSEDADELLEMLNKHKS